VPFEQFQPFGAVEDGLDVEAIAGQYPAMAQADDFFIVDDQYFGFVLHGVTSWSVAHGLLDIN
jgi:hypothetical protein